MLFILFVAGFAQSAKADDTDISTYDYAIYAKNASGETGKQCVISVNLKDKTAITSFQFDMSIPDGMTFAKDADGIYMASLSNARTTSKKTNAFDSEVQTDGKLRVICYTTVANPDGELYSFDGNDGEVCTVTINIPSDFAVGSYNVSISNVVLTQPDNTKIKVTDVVTSTLNVIKGFDGVTLDETSTTAPIASEGAVNVQVKRTIKGGEWSTICLPFAMTGEQVVSAFGNDVQLADYSGWEGTYASDDDENPSHITVSFTSVQASDGLKANHPYVIKTSADISEFTLEAVTISPESEPTVTTGSARRGTLGSFIGNYEADFTVPEKTLFLDEGQFWYSTGKTKMKAFRAYFDLLGVLQSYFDGTTSAKISFSLDGTTGINKIPIGIHSTSTVYSIDGRTIGKKELNALPSGVYIVNGKKYIVKK